MSKDYYVIGGRGNGKSLMTLKALLDKAKVSSPDDWTTNYYKTMLNAQYGSIINKLKEADKMNMSSKFKIGDIVVVKSNVETIYTDGKYAVGKPGDIGIVKRIEHNYLCLEHDYCYIQFIGHSGEYGMLADKLDLYNNPRSVSLPRNSGRYPWGDNNTIPKIKKVIFNYPATIVLFEDGTKSVVKMDDNDVVWDTEHGLAMALVKRVYGTNKSKSNYYEIFKKWLPEEEKKRNEILHIIKKDMECDLSEETADALINGYIENDKKAVAATFQEFCQNVKDAGIKEVTAETDTEELLKPKKTKEEIRDEIVDATMNGAPKKKLAELVQESRDILDCHRKGFISEFVNKWEATMFPKEFIEFCRKNNLYFYIVDSKFGGLKKCNPYKECWQKVNSYIRMDLIEYANKTVEKGPNKNRVFKAIDISKCIFSRLPKELSNGKNLEKEGGEE